MCADMCTDMCTEADWLVRRTEWGSSSPQMGSGTHGTNIPLMGDDIHESAIDGCGIHGSGIDGYRAEMATNTCADFDELLCLLFVDRLLQPIIDYSRLS